METIKLINGDCLAEMPKLADHSVDMILCDLPYGTTACSWDEIIPFDPLWAEYERVAKENAAIVLFGSQPFTSKLILSKAEWFRYCLVWDKQTVTGFLDANRKPLKCHEDIAVFYKRQPTYNPQKTKGKPSHGRKASENGGSEVYAGSFRTTESDVSGMKFPRSIIAAQKHTSRENLHPTQKPTDLLEYLIRTYTNPGDLVLDNTMGCGSTPVACVNTGRRCVGIELDQGYFAVAEQRVADVPTSLFPE